MNPSLRLLLVVPLSLLLFLLPTTQPYKLYRVIPRYNTTHPPSSPPPILNPYTPGPTVGPTVVFHAARSIDAAYFLLYVNNLDSYIKGQRPTYVICLDETGGMYVPNGKALLVINQHTLPVVDVRGEREREVGCFRPARQPSSHPAVAPFCPCAFSPPPFGPRLFAPLLRHRTSTLSPPSAPPLPKTPKAYKNLHSQRSSSRLGLLHLNHELGPHPSDSFNATHVGASYGLYDYAFRNYYHSGLCGPPRGGGGRTMPLAFP